MIKRVKPEAEEKETSEKDKVQEGAEKRRKIKKTEKRSRWVGFILFMILFVLGFLLWVGGEMRESQRFDGGSVKKSPPVQQDRDPSIIIIE